MQNLVMMRPFLSEVKTFVEQEVFFFYKEKGGIEP
jgi:hypothetical protein